MTDFNSLERSDQSSRPVELWDLVTPEATYRYTNSMVEVVYGGHTYSPVPTMRSERTAGTIDDPPAMVLTLPRGNAFVQAHAFGVPSQNMTVTITRLQDVYARGWYTGKIGPINVKGDVATVRSSSLLGDPLDGTLPSAQVRRQCNHVLYDDKCTVDRDSAANKKATTVTSVSADGLVVTVASLGTLGDKVKLGEMVRDADSERRLVIDRSGLDLTLNLPFRALAALEGITLYRGCKHDLADCDGTHGNAVNFGGHPYIPGANPFQGDIRGNPFT